MSARLRYVWDVIKQAAPFAGWVAGLVTLLYGGTIIGGAAWLANTHHRTLAVALLAAGVSRRRRKPAPESGELPGVCRPPDREAA
jgi:hypothetical protein